tara:strand:+ start:157 stop:387 length:231 start_codon:yes stop_codon:yes gene_type:complete
MKYTVIKRIHFSHADDYVSVVREAETFEDATKFKIAAEMLETEDSKNTIQILISTDDAFEFTRKPLLLTDEVKQAS